MNITFASRAPAASREDLEELLFFNPRQHKVREGIVHSVERFGQPRLEPGPEGISIRVGTHDVQALFAFDADRNASKPVGAVVFLRTGADEIAILHVAVHADYALRGKRAGLGLGIMLLEKVKEIAARIVGVQRVVFFYRQEVVIRIK